MNNTCKRCLLYEAGEKKTYQNIQDYISTISDELKVSSEVYSQRLEQCKSCDNLISGMCLKCGCYVEVRAVLKDKRCPDFEKNSWQR